MSAKHFCRLIYRVLNLDGDTAASLRLLYKLDNNLIKTGPNQVIIYMLTSMVL